MPKSFSCFLLAAALLVPAATAQTADELIAKNLAARGGKERILAVRSARITGSLSVGKMGTAPMTLEWRRPDRVRLSFEMQGLEGVQAYDGTTAWTLLPFHGQTRPEAVPSDDLQRFRDMADFDGPLVDYALKGYRVELAGREAFQGTPAYKLVLTRASGDSQAIYLDAETYLVIGATGKTNAGGAEQEYEMTVSDYKTFGGLLFACSKERRTKGAANAGQVTTYEKVELDVDIADDRFTMPKD